MVASTGKCATRYSQRWPSHSAEVISAKPYFSASGFSRHSSRERLPYPVNKLWVPAQMASSFSPVAGDSAVLFQPFAEAFQSVRGTAAPVLVILPVRPVDVFGIERPFRWNFSGMVHVSCYPQVGG